MKVRTYFGTKVLECKNTGMGGYGHRMSMGVSKY